MLFETIGFTIDQLNGDNGGAGAIAIIALRRYLLSPIMPLGGGRHITARPTSLKLVKQTSLAIASLVVVRWSTPHRGPLATGDMRHGNYEVSTVPPMLTQPPKSSAHSCTPAPFVLLATTTASRASQLACNGLRTLAGRTHCVTVCKRPVARGHEWFGHFGVVIGRRCNRTLCGSRYFLTRSACRAEATHRARAQD